MNSHEKTIENDPCLPECEIRKTPYGHRERIIAEGRAWICPDDAHALVVEVNVDGCRNYPRVASQNPLHCLSPGETVTIEDIDAGIRDIEMIIDVYKNVPLKIADCMTFDRKFCTVVKRAEGKA